MPPLPGVAVVIPCYNASRTLAQTLESVIDQLGLAELVVVDDGSSDGSAGIARLYLPADRVIEGPNRGVSAARNRGIAETSSEWLLFLDADDLLTPGTIERRIAVAEEADVVACDYQDLSTDERGTPTLSQARGIDWPALRQDAERAIASHVWITTGALLYRRRLVEAIGGFRPDLPVIQDARFMFDAAFHGARFVPSAHIGARYRITAQSLSRREPVRFWRDVLRNGRQIEALWRERGTLTADRIATLCDLYDNAGRGLLRCRDQGFFEASAASRTLGLRQSRHTRIATPLARLLGLRAAHGLLSMMGRP
ncbi:glycosyltransferase family 2 protein [Labrys sp. ZIDIC5]|uniref:glycosyltransferase family 2 protein n=1 Tax=Labrys sedimenti TaxID=3106036 RepID=UPI002ACB008B|nr:glycosyltransferase [Labrys sp. ZIDIC5]MDZ5454237.1 glycosyltransferase [Labrys sp. ZIDIC5]